MYYFGKVLACETFFTLCYLFRCSFADDSATVFAPFGSEVDDVVGRKDDSRVMFDDNDRVPFADKAVEGLEQHINVGMMQACGRFIKDKDHRVMLFLCKEGCQFDALALTTGERATALAELDISDTDILERFESFDYLSAFGVLREELDCLVNGHTEDVVDGLVAVVHVQDILFEAFAMTLFAFEYEICHELHLDSDGTFPLTSLATSTGGVEREMSRCKTELFRERLLGIETSDLIISLEVGNGVAAA